mmetsp:Transcript_72291/g.83974  ORF Transcript_72291/g.83974 Transcript_72291/m.83974 type:complete len:215 (-) Transcript_72291:93-737(-)
MTRVVVRTNLGCIVGSHPIEFRRFGQGFVHIPECSSISNARMTRRTHGIDCDSPLKRHHHGHHRFRFHKVLLELRRIPHCRDEIAAFPVRGLLLLHAEQAVQRRDDTSLFGPRVGDTDALGRRIDSTRMHPQHCCCFPVSALAKHLLESVQAPTSPRALLASEQLYHSQALALRKLDTRTQSSMTWWLRAQRSMTETHQCSAACGERVIVHDGL